MGSVRRRMGFRVDAAPPDRNRLGHTGGMLLFLLACGGPGPGKMPDCQTVYQTASAETPGDAEAGYEYCAEDDDGLGAFNRTGSVTCEADGLCSTDADCEDGEVCLCGTGVAYDGGWRNVTVLSQCIAAYCETSDDCDGQACGLSFDLCGNPQALACRTSTDQCVTDADCGDGSYCFFGGERWACQAAEECG